MSVILHLGETTTSGTFAAGHKHVTLPHGSLLKDGMPGDGASDLIAELLSELNALGQNVTLVLPGRAVRARRFSVDLPVEGTVRQEHVERSIAAMEEHALPHRHACLYHAPIGYLIDGERGDVDPLGHQGEILSAEAISLSAAMNSLVQFEQVIGEAGGHLCDILAPHLAAAAFALGTKRHGLVIHVDHGETVFTQVRQQQLEAAGTLPIGYRHLISDLMKTCELTASEARRLVNEALHSDHPEDASIWPVLECRLSELAEAVTIALKGVPELAGTVHLQGSIGKAPAVKDVFAEALGNCRVTGGPSLPKDRSAILMGATRVLQGEWGERPAVAFRTQPAISMPDRIVQWLRTHF